MNIFSLFASFAFIVYLYLSVYTIRLDPRSKLNRIFSYLSLSFSIWAFAYAFFYSSQDKEIAWFWYKISSPGWCFFPAIFLHFSLVLTENERILKKGWTYSVIYLPGIAYLYKTLNETLLVKDFVYKGLGWCEVAPSGSIWFWSYPIYYISFILAGLLLIRRWGNRSELQKKKKQAKIIATTAYPVLILAAMTDTILPALNIHVIPSIASILILIWVFGIWYSIVKYRLMILTPSIAVEGIISEMLDLLVLVNPEGNIIKVNRQIKELLGYDENELIGKPVSVIISHNNFVKEEFQNINQGPNRTHNYELTYKTKGGEVIPVNLSCFSIKDGEGDLVGVVMIGQDLRMLKQVQKTSQTLAALIRYSPLAIICTDIDTNVLIWNPAAERIFGWSEKEVLGQKNPIVPEGKKEEYFSLLESVRQGNPYFSKELQRQKKDGSPIYLNAASAAVCDADGNVRAFLGIFEDITERKQADAALRESERRFRAAFENAAVGATMVDLTGRFIKANRFLCEMLGYTEEELLTKTFSEVTHPDDVWIGLDYLKRQIAGEVEFASFEKRYFRKDGSIINLIISPAIIRDERGAPQYFVGLFQNITERKLAEEALLSSNNLLNIIARAQSKFISYADPHAIFDELLDGILSLTNSEYGFIGETLYTEKGEPYLKTYAITNIAWNKDTQEFYKKNAPVGMEFYNLKNLFGKVLLTGQPLISNSPGTDSRRGGLPEGHPPLNAFLGLPFKKAEQLVGMVGIANRPGGYDSELIEHLEPFLATCSNIIEASRESLSRKKAEEALRNSREFIKNILNTVDEAFIVIDRDYKIIMANSAYGRQSNMPIEDIIGKHCYEISHRSDKPCYESGEECAVYHSFNEGEPHVSSHKHYDKDGNIIYVESKSYPLKDDSGNVISAIEVINNITDKHLLEEQLLRTQKLEAVGLLAGGIAHDFNNLLQGVFGNISMAKMFSDKDVKSYRMLEEAERALNLSRNLTKQLLTFSKGGDPVKRVISIESFASIIQDSVRFALSGSNVNYSFSIDDNLWPVEVDEGQISQVIQNIALNASDAMPDGGAIHITAKNVMIDDRTTLQLNEGRYVMIEIEDSGIGIPEHHITKIFDPYFTTKQKGSGLGLATSYSIIKKHNGVLDVKSEAGGGSTFFIYLPASEKELSSEKPVQKGILTGKGKILLMDDEEIIRKVAGYMLKALGYEVDFAESGQQGIDKYSDAIKSGKPFDAVILDLTIRGGRGGRDTIRELIKMDPAVKAIVSSGYSDDPIMANYKDYGFKATLSKPYEIEELSKALYLIIGND